MRNIPIAFYHHKILVKFTIFVVVLIDSIVECFNKYVTIRKLLCTIRGYIDTSLKTMKTNSLLLLDRLVIVNLPPLVVKSPTCKNILIEKLEKIKSEIFHQKTFVKFNKIVFSKFQQVFFVMFGVDYLQSP